MQSIRTRRIFKAGEEADMKDNIAVGIYDALEADTLPPYIDINELNNERKGLVAAIVNHPDADIIC